MDTPLITSGNDSMPVFVNRQNLMGLVNFSSLLDKISINGAPPVVTSSGPTSPPALIAPGIADAVFAARLGDPAHLDENAYSAAADDATGQLSTVLSRKLAEAGIDPSPFTLTQDADGTVRVKGDHPDKAKIEQLFADDPALTRDYCIIAGMSEGLAMSQLNKNFAQAWRADTDVAARTQVWNSAVAKYNVLDATHEEMRWDGAKLVSVDRTYMQQAGA